MPKCPKCDKVVKNAHALKIHIGRMHKTGARRQTKRRLTGTGLSSVATAALLAELRRRADAYDRLKALTL